MNKQIIGIFILLMLPLALGATTFFDNPDNSFIMADIVLPTPVTPPVGGGGGGGAAVPECLNDTDCSLGEFCFENQCQVYECDSDLDCNDTKTCWMNMCVKLFDMQIIEVQSPINSGEEFEFTYYIKGVAAIHGDVIVRFWLVKDDKVVTEGFDTIYMADFDETTETSKLFLPSSIEDGVYNFYTEVAYDSYYARAGRLIEVGEAGVLGELLDVSFNLEKKVISDPSELLAFVNFESFGVVPSNVDLTFTIIDSDDNEVYRKVDRIVVVTEEFLEWDYENLNIPAGKYTAKMGINYGKNLFHEFSQDFRIRRKSLITGEVVGQIGEGIQTNILPILILLGIIVLVIIIRAEKRKIKRALVKERKWIGKNIFSILTALLFLIAIGILSYLNQKGILSLPPLGKSFVNLFNGIWFLIRNYWFYLVGIIVVGLIIFLLIKMRKDMSFKKFFKRIDQDISKWEEGREDRIRNRRRLRTLRRNKREKERLLKLKRIHARKYREELAKKKFEEKEERIELKEKRKRRKKISSYFSNIFVSLKKGKEEKIETKEKGIPKKEFKKEKKKIVWGNKFRKNISNFLKSFSKKIKEKRKEFEINRKKILEKKAEEFKRIQENKKREELERVANENKIQTEKRQMELLRVAKEKKNREEKQKLELERIVERKKLGAKKERERLEGIENRKRMREKIKKYFFGFVGKIKQKKKEFEINRKKRLEEKAEEFRKLQENKKREELLRVAKEKRIAEEKQKLELQRIAEKKKIDARRHREKLERIKRRKQAQEKAKKYFLDLIEEIKKKKEIRKLARMKEAKKREEREKILREKAIEEEKKRREILRLRQIEERKERMKLEKQRKIQDRRAREKLAKLEKVKKEIEKIESRIIAPPTKNFFSKLSNNIKKKQRKWELLNKKKLQEKLILREQREIETEKKNEEKRRRERKEDRRDREERIEKEKKREMEYEEKRRKDEEEKRALEIKKNQRELFRIEQNKKEFLRRQRIQEERRQRRLAMMNKIEVRGEIAKRSFLNFLKDVGENISSKFKKNNLSNPKFKDLEDPRKEFFKFVDKVNGENKK